MSGADSRRFVALDSWRGLCAILVVIFHLDQAIGWSLHGARAIQNFPLFVDFFFVLSGFVIASAYEDRLRQGYGATPFLIRRFGRIYPLHLALLIVMLMFAVVRALPLASLDPHAFFDGDIFDFTAIFTNLLLLHGIGFENHLTWNFPSWSISAEFWTYVFFALIWSRFAKLSPVIVVALVLVCPVLIALIPTRTLSFLTLVQCVYGFAAGVLVHALVMRTPTLLSHRGIAFAAEVAVLALCTWFVAFSDSPLWAAPIVFSAVVFVFAHEAGPIASLLKLKPFEALGTLSYSIYMVHAVLILIAWRIVTLAERAGFAVTSTQNGQEGWGATPVIGDIAMFVMLALVVAVSAVTYNFIEKPGRAWGQEASKRWRSGGFAALLAPSAVAGKAAD